LPISTARKTKNSLHPEKSLTISGQIYQIKALQLIAVYVEVGKSLLSFGLAGRLKDVLTKRG